jgi:hypothetical protein
MDMSRSHYTLWITAPLLVLAACQPKPPPLNGLTAREHEARAAEEERAARMVPAPTTSCLAEPEARSLIGDGPCWSSFRGPHAYEAIAHHRRLAAAHRRASEALRDAERRACAGIAEHDRVMSPFSHVDDLAAVQPLRDPATGALLGSAVRFRAVPSLTFDRLKQIVDCHRRHQCQWRRRSG